MKKITLFAIVMAMLAVCALMNAQSKNLSSLTSVTDCQGHVYPVVKMGNQYWMAENLQCTKYDTKSERAGAELSTSRKTYAPYYADGRNKSNWMTSEDAKNLKDSQIRKLGLLYNWAAVMGYTDSQSKSQTGNYSGRRQGICPNGWHVPSIDEWQTLYDYIYYDKKMASLQIGKYIKATYGWYGNGSGTDDYGFCGLPAGSASGNYVENVGSYAYWYTSDAADSKLAKCTILDYDNSELYNGEGDKFDAVSVRCLRD